MLGLRITAESLTIWNTWCQVRNFVVIRFKLSTLNIIASSSWTLLKSHPGVYHACISSALTCLFCSNPTKTKPNLLKLPGVLFSLYYS